MNKILFAIVIVILIVIPIIVFLPLEDVEPENHRPIVEITFPLSGSKVSKFVTFIGTAHDSDGDKTISKVEIFVDNQWLTVNGTTKWSYTWDIFGLEQQRVDIKARAYDGIEYSDKDEIIVFINNPITVETDSHKWALFIAASNFPKNNESKLGNGALNLAEKMTAYFVENLGYSTSNIIILFDDGWVRADNGYGEPIISLQQRSHEYDVTYAGATKYNIERSIQNVIEESNKFDDSEIFIWFAGHGCGNYNNTLTGGKILQRSEIFTWDNTITDDELGDLLLNLKSKKTCIIVDACYSGGFADKLIYNFPEFFLLKSNIPRNGRVVISGASKIRVGYAHTTEGPLFSILWFDGLTTGNADGYRPGILKTGRPTRFFKDNKVSVEEAFYYARVYLKNNEELKDYNKMEPQINDQYPHSGIIRSRDGLILGQ
jgi:hypothetical protein